MTYHLLSDMIYQVYCAMADVLSSHLNIPNSTRMVFFREAGFFRDNSINLTEAGQEFK